MSRKRNTRQRRHRNKRADNGLCIGCGDLMPPNDWRMRCRKCTHHNTIAVCYHRHFLRYFK